MGPQKKTAASPVNKLLAHTKATIIATVLSVKTKYFCCMLNLFLVYILLFMVGKLTQFCISIKSKNTVKQGVFIYF